MNKQVYRILEISVVISKRYFSYNIVYFNISF